MNFLEKIGLKNYAEEEKSSKNIAKERLQFILVQDRIKLSPAEMDEFKKDILEVIAKYIDIDDQKIEMEVNREDEMMALVANFPIKIK